MSKYNDPVIQKYIDLVKAANGEIKTFYQGDPIKIPMSTLPCLIISKISTRAGFGDQQGGGDSANDEHEMTLHFTVITDIRKELSTDEDIAKVAPGISKLYEIIEGRNEDYSLKDTSLLQILRTNQLVDVAHNLRTDLHNVTRIDYGQTLRNRNPAEWSIEATVEIVANFIQLR